MSGSFWKVLGPGLVFAAAAVGVSHLVQSTRAGAGWGLALGGLILLANVVKYPAFRFGPHFAAATGTSLLEGYRKQGRWVLVIYGLLTLGTMFSVQAGVTVVTAGLAKAAFGVPGSPAAISAGLMVLCGVLLAVGRYHWLDRIVKVLVAVFTVSTFAATALVLPRIDFVDAAFWLPPSQMDPKTLMFVAALIGWMPSAIDVAVWNSLWTLAKGKDAKHVPSVKEAMLDFHIGYVGTALLAICFLLLGAGVMHGQNVEFAASAGGFAAQVLDLYQQTLGDWSRPLIGSCAFAVMFSTTLTVLDGFPRAIVTLIERFRGPETPGGSDVETGRTYWAAIAIQALGASLVLALFMTSLPALIDVATTLSFLTAPVLAVFNHRAMAFVPDADKPKPWLRAMSAVSAALLTAFAVYYVTLLV
ncbi:MAG: divalent metal cation transporter [bacterium]